MTEKTHTKHRLSKIDQLPDELKSQLNMLLREGKMSQERIRSLINDEINQCGFNEDPEYIKRNGMSRYAQTFRKGMERYEQAQQMTQQWVGQFGEMPQTDIARALIEIGKSQVFEFQMKALEGDKPLDPKTLGHLSLAIKRLQEAQTGSVKLEKEIRKQALEEAAEKAESVAKKAGLTADTVQLLKDELLGIS
ncbi:DUF3486 family protein [Vibrio nigripulchritudo]|uniref:DUF3486 family protein n=1 Tax=Vibrio nigripulchritudo TaxID=28173 RepID=UPI0003B1D993|nr:DUF3486 family protein [Vibrio nigripulchritudo]CCN69771.1 conserved hypothetical protein [Vibrio nigripulchritudo SFn118]